MPIDPAQGKPFDFTQGKPANNLPQKPPIPPGEKRLIDFIKVPTEELFSGISQILFLASVVVVIGISIFFLGLPGLLKSVPGGGVSGKVGPLVPPINVADINFPSGFQQDIFLKNLQEAGKTRNYRERYKLLADDYSRLLGFYTGDHDPKTRKVLEQYAQYMVNTYPEHAQESIYTVPCFDSGCGTAKYPQEIQKIKADLEAASASATLRDELSRDFEAAALSSDKNFQWSEYINALSAVKSAYDLDKNEVTLSIYKELAAFIEKIYPDYKIPPQIRIGK